MGQYLGDQFVSLLMVSEFARNVTETTLSKNIQSTSIKIPKIEWSLVFVGFLFVDDNWPATTTKL